MERRRSSFALVAVVAAAAAAGIAVLAARTFSPLPGAPIGTVPIDASGADDPVAAGEAIPPGYRQLLARDAIRPIYRPQFRSAAETDWGKEYLDAIIAVRVVEDLDEAMAFIREHGSGHTEAIIADDARAAERFLHELDSAILMHNASTQYADGGEFGMGAEIGIATGRIHARGPVGAEQLTSYKYLVRGSGQTRP